MGESVLELQGVTKTYRRGLFEGEITALAGIHLAVCRGEIHGLLGLNGAGKSTANRIAMGFITPTFGDVLVFGRPVHETEVMSHVGYLAENPAFYEFLTGQEHLELAAGLHGYASQTCRSIAGRLLGRVGLSAEPGRRVKEYSKGMRQRLGIAQALVNDPALLVLDEPYSGLDPLGRTLLKGIIAQERARGAAILLSSHELLDAEGLCDRVTILHRGEVIKGCPISQLRQEFPQSNLEEIFVRLLGPDGGAASSTS